MGKRRCREGFVPDENGYETNEMSDELRKWIEKVRAGLESQYPTQVYGRRPVKDVDVEVVDIKPRKLPAGSSKKDADKT
jgi:hypothetical protein